MGQRTLKKCTMQDIANASGVSIATVSHVLHGSGNVSDATRERVRDVARKLHYVSQSDSGARFRQNRKVVGIILQDVRNEFYAACAGSVLSCADGSVYTVVIHDCGYSRKRALDAVQECIYQNASGIIFFGGTADNEPMRLANSCNIPVVLANCHVDGFNVVSFNHVRAMRDVVSRLFNAGRRKFLYMTETPELQSVRERQDGFLLGMTDCNLSPEQCLVISDKRLQRKKAETAHEVLSEYLTSNGLWFDTLLTSSDLIAIGALHCLREMQIRVPDDVWLVGYDNISVSALVSPALTTINQDTDRLGEVAFSLLLEIIQTSDFRPKQVTIENTIIVRESALI